MTMSTPARTDAQIRQSVQDELEWSADAPSDGIGIAVERGVVVLTGEVDDGFARRAAMHAALRTVGVKDVVDELLVHAPSAAWVISDEQVARTVTDALTVLTTLPSTVRATVDDHVVTLLGDVEWHYQRENARRAVEGLSGVSHVVNAITLHPRASALDAGQRIRQALVRNAILDAEGITVTVADNTATLTGHVHSFAERTEAEQAAWSSPHITDVRDYLTVTG